MAHPHGCVAQKPLSPMHPGGSAAWLRPRRPPMSGIRPSDREKGAPHHRLGSDPLAEHRHERPQLGFTLMAHHAALTLAFCAGWNYPPPPKILLPFFSPLPLSRRPPAFRQSPLRTEHFPIPSQPLLAHTFDNCSMLLGVMTSLMDCDRLLIRRNSLRHCRDKKKWQETQARAKEGGFPPLHIHRGGACSLGDSGPMLVSGRPSPSRGYWIIVAASLFGRKGFPA